MNSVHTISFDKQAKSIISAFKAFDTASGKLTQTVNREFQNFIDAWSVANDRGEASCKAMQKEIRECEVVLNIVASGAMDRKTFTEYANSAARALHWAVPFEASLKNNSDLVLPWSKKGTGTKPGTSGSVTSTTRDELDKTISKVLAQMRILGLTELAAETLDLMIDRLDGFKETVLAK